MNIVTISNITTEPFLAKSLSKHFADYQITYAALSLEEIYDDVSKAILQSTVFSMNMRNSLYPTYVIICRISQDDFGG